MKTETFRSDPEGSTPSRQRRSPPAGSEPCAGAVTFFAKRRQRMPKPGVEPRNALHAGAFGFATPGAASSEPQMARFWRSDRGLRAGQRHGMGGQGTREIPHASMTRKNRSEGTPVEQSSWPVGVLHAIGSA